MNSNINKRLNIWILIKIIIISYVYINLPLLYTLHLYSSTALLNIIYPASSLCLFDQWLKRPVSIFLFKKNRFMYSPIVSRFGLKRLLKE